MYSGKLVRLREYRQEDTERAQSFVNDYEVARFLNTGVLRPSTLRDEEDWVGGQTSRSDVMSFAIETLEDGLYIGGCGLNEISWKNRSCVVGIMIGDKHYWSRGYGTDAMRVLMRFCFQEMNLNRVALRVFSFNERAIRSYQKLGFKTEGVLRQTIFREGQYHDEHVMSVLKDEWQG